MTVLQINKKIKEKLKNEFNKNLYKRFNMTISDSNSLFGYYDDYLYELIDRVYIRYGPRALREEMKYMLGYLDFLFIKLENNSLYDAHILIYHYFKRSYKHYSRRSIEDIRQLKLSFSKEEISV